MSGFSHIIFDLDGTLTDSRQGIGNSLRYAMEKMNLPGYTGELLDQFVGPPLQWGFRRLLGLTKEETDRAIGYFREYFGEKGLYENEPYPGIPDLLKTLHDNGKKLYIATSKLEKYAREIILHFGFDRYIILLKGADYAGEKATKQDLISDLLKMEKLIPSKKILMAGDTVFDIEGGKKNHLSTLAVLYGYGKKKQLINAEPDLFAGNTDELYQILSM